MYNYPGLSTFQQAGTTNGVVVPSPHAAPSSSNCVTTSAAALAGTAQAYGVMSTVSTSSMNSTSSSSSSASVTIVVSTSTAGALQNFAPTASTTPSPFGSGSGLSSGSAGSGVGSILISRAGLTASFGIAAFVVFAIAL